MNITEITKIKNVRVKNLHNGIIYPTQNILKVSFENGNYRIIDLMSEKDITDIDYFTILITRNTKEKILFKDLEVRGV